MRAGWLVSLIGHVGAALMTTLVWQSAVESLPVGGGAIVPIEIADVALETNIRALAEDAPADEFDIASLQPGQPAPQVGPPNARPRQPQRTFNVDAADAAMNNADADNRPKQREGDPSDRNQEGAGAGDANRATLEDIVRSVTQNHLRRCWRSTLDASNPQDLVVTLRFALDREGRISGEVQLVSPREHPFLSGEQRAAIANARRAARLCEPYPFANHAQLREHYAVWRVNSYRFGAQQ